MPNTFCVLEILQGKACGILDSVESGVHDLSVRHVSNVF